VRLEGARSYFAPNSCGGGASKGLPGKFEGGATSDRVFGFVFFGIRLGGHDFFLAEISAGRKKKEKIFIRIPRKAILGGSEG